jgi:prepilin-type N-terminal cleavage/methylation domain-containing protein
MVLDKQFWIVNTEYVMKRTLAQGFTLVELLIVIALLGVIATIVIAAINPIEQANRASDAGLKADASQIVSAIQRYYASHNYYPWESANCTTNGGTQCTISSEVVFPFLSADDPSVGICGAAGATCKTTTNQGELISALELQTTFVSKNWVGAAGVNRIMVGKAVGSSSGVFACWIPKSSSNRQKLISSGLTVNKMVDISGFTSAGIPNASTSCTTPTDANWANALCYECVPE